MLVEELETLSAASCSLTASTVLPLLVLVISAFYDLSRHSLQLFAEKMSRDMKLHQGPGMQAAVFYDSEVITASISCCLKLAVKYDGDASEVEELLSKTVTRNPVEKLDLLLQYLLFVHKVDFYSEDWSPGPEVLSELRPDPAEWIGLTEEERRDAVHFYVKKLTERANVITVLILS